MKHPIPATVTGALLGIALLSCQPGSPVSPGEEPVTPSDILGYWSEYQKITRRELVDAAGTETKDTSTLYYADDYTRALLFDTDSLQWVRWTNNRYCYEVENPTPYEIDDREFTADLFTGQQINGTDTLDYTSTIVKVGNELVITTTFLGIWAGTDTRIEYEYWHFQPSAFPPSHWPDIQCP